jgi:hypothetical protein
MPRKNSVHVQIEKEISRIEDGLSSEIALARMVIDVLQSFRSEHASLKSLQQRAGTPEELLAKLRSIRRASLPKAGRERARP